MQMQIFRRVGLGLMALGLTLSAFAILSCGSSDDGSSDETERNAALSGAGERNAAGAVPAATASSPGSGTAVLTVSGDQTQIAYVLTYRRSLTFSRPISMWVVLTTLGRSSSSCVRI